jgi:hypothetical protein
MCSGICTREKKVSELKNWRFYLQFFTKILFYNSVWIRIQIRTFFGGFGFGPSQNIRILSDSDPQHWYLGSYSTVQYSTYRYRINR